MTGEWRLQSAGWNIVTASINHSCRTKVKKDYFHHLCHTHWTVKLGSSVYCIYFIAIVRYCSTTSWANLSCKLYITFLKFLSTVHKLCVTEVSSN